MAAAGLSGAGLRDAERRIRELTPEPVDVVRLEDAAPSLRARILADGEALS